MTAADFTKMVAAAAISGVIAASGAAMAMRIDIEVMKKDIQYIKERVYNGGEYGRK